MCSIRHLLFSLFVALAGLDAVGATIHVSSTQTTNAEPEGLSWSTALPNLGSAMAVAQRGDEIWVAAGEYTGTVLLASGVAVYGGFAGTEISLAERDWDRHRTILKGGGTGTIVRVEGEASVATRLDGLTITNGAAIYGGGIICANSALTVENVLITGNTAQRYGGGIFFTVASGVVRNSRVVGNTSGDYGGGIACFLSEVTLEGNEILANRAGLSPLDSMAVGGGIYCAIQDGSGDPPEPAPLVIITGNLIKNNQASSGGGISFDADAQVVMEGNTLAFNSAAAIGGGVECYLSSPTIRGNRFIGNRLTQPVFGGSAIGVYSPTPGGATPLIENNAILGNTVEGTTWSGSGAIFCNEHADPVVRNNTLVGNRSVNPGASIRCLSSNALFINNILAWHSGSPSVPMETFHHNCLTDPWYSGDTNRNFRADPQFTTNLIYGDVRLLPGSPCRNAGSDSFGVSAVDLLGALRVQDGVVDVGAVEIGAPQPEFLPRVFRVAPDGADANDGGSWQTPLLSVRSALDYAAALGGEVWVREGTYPTILLQLRPFGHLYGGFEGTETRREDRDLDQHPTVLNGNLQAPVVVASNVPSWSTLDGFTVMNGSNQLGGGVVLVNSDLTLRSNRIVNNHGSRAGGVYIKGGAPTVSGNFIADNQGRSGGGLGIDGGKPELEGNVITGNSSQLAGGAWVSPDGGHMVNNLITSNRVDLLSPGSAEAAGGLALSMGRSENREPFLVAGNWIVGNTIATDLEGQTVGGGVNRANGFYGNVVNNTIVGNSIDGGGAGGMWLSASSHSSAVVGNNLVAFNSSGIGGSTGLDRFLHNCVYGNDDHDFVGYPDPMGAGGNLSEDPLLASDRLNLLDGSPAIDAGDTSLAVLGSPDLDGEARWSGESVDIGADEAPGTPSWQPVDNPYVASTPMVTHVGGITYAQFETAALGPCLRYADLKVVTNGFGDFTIDIQLLASSEVCEDPGPERRTLVFGELPAGTYQMHWSSWGEVLHSQGFSVTPASDPTLALLPSGSDAAVTVQAEGVADVEYVVLRSADFREWTPIHTNLGAPFTFSVPAMDSAAGFFRLQILEPTRN